MTTYKSNIQKLDSPWRRIALPPKETLQRLGLTDDVDFADIGCGIGYFTIPAAAMIQTGHKIYAIDPAADMIAEAHKRAVDAGIDRIQFVQSEPQDFKIPLESIDFALLANVFHEISEKELFVRQIWEILRPGGKLALIEWNNQIMDMGPPENHRISEEDTDRYMLDGGFERASTLDLGEMFFGKVYIKQC